VNTKKRFIADAICPKCHSSDTLRWWVENQIEFVECVECDYVERRTPRTVEQSQHAREGMIGIFKPD
jgi:uncharacterized metal-binding protein (TIGR02443 family)